jgi:DNA-binding GntR family transcriptional regulator
MSGAAARAYEIIKSEISTGRLPANSRLRETKLAELTGVSRTPVREALRLLEVDGFVENNPNTGAHVAVWSEGELQEITDLRALLEGFGAGLAATKITDAEIQELERLEEKMESVVEEALPDFLVQLSELNKRFHLAVVEATGNRRLIANIHSIVHGPLVFRKFSVLSDSQKQRSLSHHREIISALKLGDRDWATSIMRNHILAGRSADIILQANADSGSGGK